MIDKVGVQCLEQENTQLRKVYFNVYSATYKTKDGTDGMWLFFLANVERNVPVSCIRKSTHHCRYL